MNNRMMCMCEWDTCPLARLFVRPRLIRLVHWMEFNMRETQQKHHQQLQHHHHHHHHRH